MPPIIRRRTLRRLPLFLPVILPLFLALALGPLLSAPVLAAEAVKDKGAGPADTPVGRYMRYKKKLFGLYKNGDIYEAADKSFTVYIPGNWGLDEGDQASADADFVVRATAPGAEVLHAVQFTVRRSGLDAAAEEQDQARLSAGAARSVRPIAGREAVVLTRAAERSLPGYPDRVKSIVRTHIVPQDAGCFVLVWDAPEALDGRHLPVLERMLASFKPAP